MWSRVLYRRNCTLVSYRSRGILGATLVRFVPGFDVDECELDMRLCEDSVQFLHGGFGVCPSFACPIANRFAGTFTGRSADVNRLRLVMPQEDLAS